MTKGLTHEGPYGTMYYVHDMAKAVGYFRDAVGLAPTHESPEWTEFHLGPHALCFHLVDPSDPSQVGRTRGGILIVKVRDIRGHVARLKANGVQFVMDVKEVHPGAWSADFVDPDGNEYSLYEDTNRR